MASDSHTAGHSSTGAEGQREELWLARMQWSSEAREDAGSLGKQGWMVVDFETVDKRKLHLIWEPIGSLSGHQKSRAV